jgi:hypothetical protein
LDDGKQIDVSSASKSWGRIGFTIDSHVSSGRLKAGVLLPAAPFPASVKLRLRAPDGKRLQSVTLNGRAWTAFDAAEESVTLPTKMSGKVAIAANYQ